jgi:UDP-3-O-[3-hydroxymyristoyl] N-acetylglucosamine deacetylase/3-hydroxyacyl-[acyl-carrier-protein] dehydratase
VVQQQTLREPARFSGIGLHSGNRVNLAFLPAPAGSGFRFRRVDLEGAPEVPARLENVIETSRSTTLAQGSVKVQTVEHVLAALAGCGVDNAIVELDSSEPPIADGSAREYCRMIDGAGVVPQGEPRETYAVTEAIQ